MFIFVRNSLSFNGSLHITYKGVTGQNNQNTFRLESKLENKIVNRGRKHISKFYIKLEIE